MERIKEYYNLSTETVDKIKNENNIKINPQIYVDKDNEFIWPTVNNHKSCGYCYALKTHIGILSNGTVVLRIGIEDFISNHKKISSLLRKVIRLTISFINIEEFHDDLIPLYKNALDSIHEVLL